VGDPLRFGEQRVFDLLGVPVEPLEIAGIEPAAAWVAAGAAVNRAHGIAASAAKAKTPILPTGPATDLIRKFVFISMPLS
jgi:hypothetical protein